MTQHTPVLVGISHLEQRFTDFESAKEPVQLMIEAVNAAAEDAGSKALLDAGSVRVIRGIWPYQDPARAVAQAIGSPNAETVLSPYGGNFVQTVLNQSALDIQSGKTGISILSYESFGKSMSRTRTKITFCQISPKISHLEYEVLHNSYINLYLAVILSPK